MLTISDNDFKRLYTFIRENYGNIMDKDTKGRPRNGGC